MGSALAARTSIAGLLGPSRLRLLETMAEEVNAQRVGAATVLARLAGVIATRVVRTWVVSSGP
jgi:hypothetical protein